MNTIDRDRLSGVATIAVIALLPLIGHSVGVALAYTIQMPSQASTLGGAFAFLFVFILGPVLFFSELG